MAGKSPFDEAIDGLLAEPSNVAEMQKIIDLAMAHARQVFTFGTLSERTRISLALVGSAARNAQQARQSEAERQMRDDYAELRKAVQRSVTAIAVPIDQPPKAERDDDGAYGKRKR